MNIDDINYREGDEVTQALQGRSDQTGSAVADQILPLHGRKVSMAEFRTWIGKGS
jgi:hypothetical protein